jgi:L-proline 4-hydroxylase
MRELQDPIRHFQRPAYLAHRDLARLECLPDDCLPHDYAVPLRWRDGASAAALRAERAA